MEFGDQRHLTATFKLWQKACCRGMMRRVGAGSVNISSVGRCHGNPGQGELCRVQGRVCVGMSKSLAIEVARPGSP